MGAIKKVVKIEEKTLSTPTDRGEMAIIVHFSDVTDWLVIPNGRSSKSAEYH